MPLQRTKNKVETFEGRIDVLQKVGTFLPNFPSDLQPYIFRSHFVRRGRERGLSLTFSRWNSARAVKQRLKQAEKELASNAREQAKEASVAKAASLSLVLFTL